MLVTIFYFFCYDSVNAWTKLRGESEILNVKTEFFLIKIQLLWCRKQEIINLWHQWHEWDLPLFHCNNTFHCKVTSTVVLVVKFISVNIKVDLFIELPWITYSYQYLILSKWAALQQQTYIFIQLNKISVLSVSLYKTSSQHYKRSHPNVLHIHIHKVHGTHLNQSSSTQHEHCIYSALPRLH